MNFDSPEMTGFIIEPPTDEPAFGGALKISTVLKKSGFDAWLAGGSVRDLVMGMTPHDFDIATSARPEDVQRLFDRTVPVGAQFGVVIVRMFGFEYEVATFRADCGYSDGRRPDEVRYTDLREDVMRRDFTMNGLVMDAETGRILDLVGGIPDIRDRIIRAIGDPRERFAEDRLRQMRAVRFAAQTGFSIEPETLNAVTACASSIGSVSAERIAEEYRKMLLARDPATGFRLTVQTGLLKHTIPELTGKIDREFTARLLNALRGSGIETMWAAVLSGTGSENAAAILKRLRRSNSLCDSVRHILAGVEALNSHEFGDPAADKRLIRRPLFAEAVRLRKHVLALEDKDPAPIVLAMERMDEWTDEDLCPVPLVTGNDIIAAGVAKGPEIARLLRWIEDGQLRGEILTREQALDLIKSLPRIQ